MRKRPSWFVAVTDYVSYFIGTPANIGFWVFAVAVWIALGPYTAKHDFMPAWFTSNGFNFPLNTVTTLAELYIGFLVAAATNRSEKALKDILNKLLNHMNISLRAENKLMDLERELDQRLRAIESKLENPNAR